MHVLLDYYSEEIFVLAGKNDATLELSLESKPVKSLIDSGASTNVIDNYLYEQVKSTESRLSKSFSKIYPYGSNTPLEMLGQTKLKLQIPDSEHTVDFQVLKSKGKPIIGRKTATDLGLLHIRKVHFLAEENTDTIIKSFEDRFQGTGKFKNFSSICILTKQYLL